MPVSALHFVTWRKRLPVLRADRLADGLSLNLTGMGEPERLDVRAASATLFPLLGVQRGLGRSFLEEEGPARARPRVMLSDPLWHRDFQSDPGVVGRRSRSTVFPSRWWACCRQASERRGSIDRSTSGNRSPFAKTSCKSLATSTMSAWRACGVAFRAKQAVAEMK